MFGVLKPAICGLSQKCKESYNLTYCNLCAALSASGAGMFNRLFLVNDVVTIDWLLRADRNTNGYAFKCYNCTKGGVIGRKKSVSEHQKFLAAVSSYVCGVKLRDNAADSKKIINKLMFLAYKPILKKAEGYLKKLELLDKFKHYEAIDSVQESQKISDLEKASLPTESCYELFTLEDSKYITTLPKELLSLLGRYLGRCVYYLDAIADMDKDNKAKQFNVLNLKVTESNGKYDKAEVVGLCLDYLKPMRHELSAKIDALPQKYNVELIKSRWNSLFNSIEKQLAKLIIPFNNLDLVKKIMTFNPTCSCSESSSWSSIKTSCGFNCCDPKECCCCCCSCGIYCCLPAPVKDQFSSCCSCGCDCGCDCLTKCCGGGFE